MNIMEQILRAVSDKEDQASVWPASQTSPEDSITVRRFDHTPGPWWVGYANADVSAKDSRLTVWPASVEDGGRGGCICHVSPELTQNEEDKANARLIASAPDLLEALEKARDYILSVAAKSADAEHDYADFELLKRVDLVIDRAIGNPAPSNF